MIVRRKKGERDLFGIVLQPRLVKPEPAELYDAVLALRSSGVQVFRAGRDKHLVRPPTSSGGRKVTTPVLLGMAAAARAWRTTR